PFNAAQASTEVARWALTDPAGSATATDSTGNGHDATVTLTAPAALGAPGRIVNGPTVLSTNGVSGNQVSTPGRVLDTGKNLTVAAWVRLADGNAYRGVVSQDGVHQSGFRLEYAHTCGCWEFAMPTTDTVNPGWVYTRAPGPARIGVWTHLVGVY